VLRVSFHVWTFYIYSEFKFMLIPFGHKYFYHRVLSKAYKNVYRSCTSSGFSDINWNQWTMIEMRICIRVPLWGGFDVHVYLHIRNLFACGLQRYFDPSCYLLYTTSNCTTQVFWVVFLPNERDKSIGNNVYMIPRVANHKKSLSVMCVNFDSFHQYIFFWLTLLSGTYSLSHKVGYLYFIVAVVCGYVLVAELGYRAPHHWV